MSEQQITKVEAEAHSDDYAVQVRFDAAPYLLAAHLDDIVALADEEWGYSEEADAVVDWTAENVPGSSLQSKLLAYCDLVRNTAHACGYECQLHEREAVQFLLAHRPDVYTALRSRIYEPNELIDDDGMVDLDAFADEPLVDNDGDDCIDDYAHPPAAPATVETKRKPTIIVVVEGGRVSQVLSDQPDVVNVLVVDMDEEKIGEDWLWDEDVWYPARDVIDDEAWDGITAEAASQGIEMPAIDRGPG